MTAKWALILAVSLASLFILSHTVDGLSLKKRDAILDEEGNIVVEPDRINNDSNVGDDDMGGDLSDSLPSEDTEDADMEQPLLMPNGDNAEESGESKVIEPERHDDDIGLDDEENGLPDEDTLPEDDSSDFSEVLRRRKRDALWQKIRLSRNSHPLEVTWVEAIDETSKRIKRTSYKTVASTWPRHIPYNFDKSFNPDKEGEVRNVLDYLEGQLCVKFTLETNFDPSNPNWFKENGYTTNAYLSFRKASGCYAYTGRGTKDAGPRVISPCNDYMTMMHEVMHALGGMHAQSFPERDRYITVHKDNIIKGMTHNYSPVNAATGKVTYKYFDSHSMLMYYPSDFSINGQETFNYLRPDMGSLYGPNSYQSILSEMTRNYHCVEEFCSDSQLDCGIGHIGYIHSTCSCICPEGYDPEKNCQSLINEAPPSGEWPDTPFTLYKAGSKCPTGFEEGLMPVHGIRKPKMTGISMPTSGYTLNLETCKRKTSGKTDFGLLPKGSYCLVKPSHVDCQEPFKEGSITINTKTSNEPTGDVGDVTVDGNILTMKFCCTRDRNIVVPMRLPISEPFRLTPSNTGKCQAVEGAWVTPGLIDVYNRGPTFTKIPFAQKNRILLRQLSCYYEPAKYGCSELLTLDANTKSATVSSPGFGSQREGARRCFYGIKAPENSKIRITFDTFSISSDDLFLLKRFHKWQRPYRIYDYMRPTQMISENNFMFVEYWSHSEVSDNYKGVQLTFDVILSPEDSCYDEETNGKDYAGDKAISETYQQCLPWKDAVNCEEFPFTDGDQVLQLINSGNKCRNPTGNMLQPWCYVYINDTMCIRRYCDACNHLDGEDKLLDCDSKIAADSSFCSDSLARLGCFKSCQMTNPSYNKDDVKCSTPMIPSEMASSDSTADTYNVGDKISVTCNGQTSDIECTTHGWTPFSDECVAELCVDASQLCQRTLELFPNFCQDARFASYATVQCKRSCGQCDSESVTCSAESTDIVTRTSESDSVSPGQVATFACKDGFHLAGGDVSRACSISGELLGKEMICQETPLPAEVNIQGIRNRRVSMSGKHAMLLDGPAWHIPIKGMLTKWYYYCKSTEPIALLVYRRTSDSSKFQLIGYNEADCIREWPWSFNVPTDQQIAVEAGDLIGVYNLRSTVASYSCSWSKQKPLTVKKAKVSKLATLVSKSEYSFKDTCMHISIGAHVEPSV